MNFKLRPWKENDIDCLVKDANNPKIAKFLTNQFPHPYTLESGKKFIAMAMSKELPTIFCIDVDGEAAGGIGLHPQSDIHEKNAELGYWLAEPFWGKGIVTQAITEIVEYGFINLDITRVFAVPFGTNKGSQRVLEKAGFQLEARLSKSIYKNGEYLDELIYSTRKGKS